MDKHKILSKCELLFDAFYFDDATLNFNRNGQLTVEQFERLSAIRNENFILVMFLCLGSLSLSNLASFLPLIGYILTFAIPAAWLIYNRMWLVFQLFRDLRQIHIAVIQDVIYLDMRSTFQIQNLKFRLNRRQTLALKNREPYIIYYLPNSRQILAVEPVVPS